MNSIVKEKLPQLAELCKKYRVERMYLFGSAARDDLFGREGDLVAEETISKPHIIANINRDKQLVYVAA